MRTDLDALPIIENTGLPYASHVKVKGANGGASLEGALGKENVLPGEPIMASEDFSFWKTPNRQSACFGWAPPIR